ILNLDCPGLLCCGSAKTEGILDEACLLANVPLVPAFRRACPSGAADVDEWQPSGQKIAQAGRNVQPGAHVPRLLLEPDDLLQIRIGGDQLRELLGGEWVELLHPSDRDRLDRPIFLRSWRSGEEAA